MKKVLLISALLCVVVFSVFSQNKTALLIANGDYDHFSVLPNPVKEAKELKAALQRIGFSVILVTDASKEEMLDALYDFETELEERGGIALFHYGGHAVQVEGKNYLIPADADIPDERRVSTRALDSDEVMATLDVSGSESNIVILDSCRNNPLPGASRSGTRGLAVMGKKPQNSIIVYSAESGTVAEDGLFTPALLKYIEIPGMSFSDVVRNTRTEVFNASNGIQTPGAYDQTFEDIYLAGSSSSSNVSVSRINQVQTGSADLSGTGEVYVTAEDGAVISINGKEVGKAPNLFADIPAGTVVVEARKDNRYGSREVFLSTGDLAEIAIPMDTMTGRLLVRTDISELIVEIDGKSYGILTGSALREIPAGSRKIILRGMGYYSEGTVEISENETASYEPEIRTVGSLRYTMPEGSTGRFQAEGETVILTGTGVIDRLDTGEYLITTTGADYKQNQQRVSISRGQVRRFEPDLEYSDAYLAKVKEEARVSFQTRLQEQNAVVETLDLTEHDELKTSFEKLVSLSGDIEGSGYDFPEVTRECGELLGIAEEKVFASELEAYKGSIAACDDIDTWKTLRDSLLDYEQKAASLQYVDTYDLTPAADELTGMLKTTGIGLYKTKLDELAYMQEEEAARVKSMNNAGWSLLGVGSSSLAAFGVFLGLAPSTYDDYQEATLTTEAEALWADLVIYQILYWVTGGTGLLLDIIGIPLAVTDGSLDELANEIDMWNVELMQVENHL